MRQVESSFAQVSLVQVILGLEAILYQPHNVIHHMSFKLMANKWFHNRLRSSASDFFFFFLIAPFGEEMLLAKHLG